MSCVMSRLVLTAAVLGLSTCGGADPVIQAEPAAPLETNYTVLDDQSSVAVSATQQGEVFTGAFERFDADIRFFPDDLPASEVRVRLPIAALDLGDADRNDAVPGASWFAAKLHPVATFETQRIRADGDGYVADGELTMKGFTAPVSLPFTLEERADGTVRMEGEVELDRTRWNLGEAPWDTEEWVGHSVTVQIELVAEKA